MVTTATDGLGVAVASSLDEWQRVVSRSFVPLEIARRRPGAFRGDIRSRTLHDVSLCQISATSHEVHRTAGLIDVTGGTFLKVSLQLAGTGLLVQDGREAVLRPGDLAVYDTGRPYTLTFDDDFQSMVMIFPRGRLGLPADAVAELTAVRVAAGTGLGQVISPFLVQLAEHMGQVSAGSERRLAHNALDLVSTMFTEQLGRVRRPTEPRRQLLDRIQVHIEENLGDPDLCPTTVAAAHYISTRHLHAVFHDHGTTIAAWIRSRRLEHCRRDLLDPAQSDRSVAMVAADRGFLDAAHFSRIFKAAFGMSPGAYRRAETGSAHGS